ncbi:MAG: SPOR domain-containing protein, partial [Rubrivivax sp.]|nr:SPOR domain-containing protein [Rubrivivax sp.]
PAPKPAPDKPAAKPVAEPYVVQLAALSDAAMAEALRARAAAVGLPAYTDTLGKLTRVRVGPFATREEAAAAAVKLAENGMTSAQVVAK